MEDVIALQEDDMDTNNEIHVREVNNNITETEEVKIEQKKPVTSYGFLPTTMDGWAIFLTYYTLTILFFVAAYFGGQLTFYQDLIKLFPQNTWLVAGLWVIASLISYVSFYLVRNADPNLHLSQILWTWFLVTNYLNILWVVLFYLYQSFMGALILVFLIILIYFYLMVLLFSVNVWAALALLPLEALYAYLFWSLMHLASVNGIII